MNRRELFGASILLTIAPWFVPPERYHITIKTHVLKNFKKSKFVNHWHGVKHIVPSFRIAKDRALSDRDPAPADANLTVDNALSHRVVTENIRALAEAAYNVQARDVVVCNLILESPDGHHVTKVGMTSIHDNIPIWIENV